MVEFFNKLTFKQQGGPGGGAPRHNEEMGRSRYLKEGELNRELSSSSNQGKLVVVYFTATWCGYVVLDNWKSKNSLIN